MADKNIDHLHPAIREKCVQFLANCKAAGLDVRLLYTFRSNAEQAALYAKGRTVVGNNPRPGRPMGDTVTNAKPGTSKHNYMLNGQPASLAFDAVPFLPNGTIDWTGKHADWKRMASVGKALGLKWGGDWPGIVDMPHFEVSL